MMMKWIHSPRFLGTMALLVGMGLSGAPLKAQQDTPQSPDQTTPSQQAPDQQTPTQQTPSDPKAQQPSQPPAQSTPDAQAQTSPAGQVFAGTIVKTGDKYVLQTSSGTAYDVDRQDLLAKFEGKQVRINGTLDPDGKTIHVK